MNKYDGDAVFEVWRRGGNPDLVDLDRLDEHRANGLDADEAGANEWLRQQRRRIVERDEFLVRAETEEGR